MATSVHVRGREEPAQYNRSYSWEPKKVLVLVDDGGRAFYRLVSSFEAEAIAARKAAAKAARDAKAVA